MCILHDNSLFRIHATVFTTKNEMIYRCHFYLLFVNYRSNLIHKTYVPHKEKQSYMNCNDELKIRYDEKLARVIIKQYSQRLFFRDISRGTSTGDFEFFTFFHLY
eukprot:UN25013